MNEMSFAFWSRSWVSGKQMGRDIFFRLQRVSWYFCFSRVNLNRVHESSLLLLMFTKYLEVAIVLFLYANVTRYFYFLLQRVIWHPYFWQGDTLVLHKGVEVMNREHLFPRVVYYFYLEMVTWHFCFSQGSKFN